MASITKDNTTGGKFRVRAIDSQGEDIELFFDTHIEAQAIANVETQNQREYFEQFEVVDGTEMHLSGLNFREWLKKSDKETELCETVAQELYNVCAELELTEESNPTQAAKEYALKKYREEQTANIMLGMFLGVVLTMILLNI